MALSFAGGLVGCSGASGGSGGPVPPAAASPGRVARVYLRAALASNCALTGHLTMSTTWNWCSDPRLLRYRSVGRAYFVPASEAGRDEQCVDFEMYTHGSSDGTMPTGWAPWGFCFARTHAGWRLFDQGEG